MLVVKDHMAVACTPGCKMMLKEIVGHFKHVKHTLLRLKSSQHEREGR